MCSRAAVPSAAPISRASIRSASTSRPSARDAPRPNTASPVFASTTTRPRMSVTRCATAETAAVCRHPAPLRARPIVQRPVQPAPRRSSIVLAPLGVAMLARSTAAASQSFARVSRPRRVAAMSPTAWNVSPSAATTQLASTPAEATRWPATSVSSPSTSARTPMVPARAQTISAPAWIPPSRKAASSPRRTLTRLPMR